MRLSVITVNLNNHAGLEKTIKSVVVQSFADFEYIVIDGGSTDGSVEVIKEYSSRVTYWVSEADRGIYNAMNKGIKEACGDYCLFLNSGDRFYDKDVLTKVFQTGFSEDIVYGIQLRECDGNIIEDPCLDLPYLTFGTLKKSHIPHQCTFIKRKLFESVGMYNEENRVVSDWEFIMLALFKHDCSIRRIYLPITVYDTGGISSNRDKTSQNTERARALRTHFPLIIRDYEYFEQFMNKKYIRFTLAARNFAKGLLKRG